MKNRNRIKNKTGA